MGTFSNTSKKRQPPFVGTPIWYSNMEEACMFKPAIVAVTIFVCSSVGITACQYKTDQAQNNNASSNSNNSYSPDRMPRR
jgi:hypothetical protein